MGLLSGAMSFRRFQVGGKPPEDFRVSYSTKFMQSAFRGSVDTFSEEESYGWTTIHNLLDTDFSDSSRWFVEPYIHAMLRIDKKSVPANLLRAHVKQRCDDWCRENNQERIPRKVKTDIKDTIKNELLSKTLPKVKTIEFCWDIENDFLLFYNTSKRINEQFFKIFFETFGLPLDLFYPSLYIEDQKHRMKLESLSMSNLTVLLGDDDD